MLAKSLKNMTLKKFKVLHKTHSYSKSCNNFFIVDSKLNGCNGEIIWYNRFDDTYENFSLEYLNPYEGLLKFHISNFVEAEEYQINLINKKYKDKKIRKKFFVEVIGSETIYVWNNNNKLTCKVKSDKLIEHYENVDFKQTLRYLNKKGLHSLIFPKKYISFIEFNIDSPKDIKEILPHFTVKSYMCQNGPSGISLNHNIIGWQQFLDGYIYRKPEHRSLVALLNENSLPSMIDTNFHFDRIKLYEEYENMEKLLNITDNKFSIPLFLYMLFGNCKSLFSHFPRTSINLKNINFALNIHGTDSPENNIFILKYIACINKNFNSLTNVDFNNSHPIEFLKKPLKIKIHDINKYALLKDIPILKFYYSKSQNFTKHYLIPDKCLLEELSSQASYLYYNLKNNSNNLIDMISPNVLSQYNFENFKVLFNNIDKLTFPNIINAYLLEIAEIIWKDISFQEENRRKELIDEFINNKDKMDSIIFYLMEKLANSDYGVDTTIKLIRSFNYKQYNYLLEAFEKKELNNYIDKLLYEDDSVIFPNSTKKKNTIFDELSNYMCEKYREAFVKEYINTPNYHTKYFDNLYKNSYKKLSAKKGDKVASQRYAFLLSMLESFKEFIDRRMTKKSEDFQLFYNKAFEILYGFCHSAPYNSDEFILKLFAEFINCEIERKNIVAYDSDMNTHLGWINNTSGELFLINKERFYLDFILYANKLGYTIPISKTAFVRNILHKNSIIQKRTAGKVQRYDRELIFNNVKHCVLAIDYNGLNSYIK